MIVQFENVELTVQEDSKHEWLLETDLVAKGYGIAPSNIRKHKMTKEDEFVENKHFVTVTNSNGGEPKMYWTKKGVIRLGFFIRSQQAKRFRDWAEDLIVKKLEQPLDSISFLRNQLGLLNGMMDEMESTKTEVRSLRQEVEIVKAQQTSSSSDYFAVAGFAALKKIPISTPLASKIGIKAKNRCQELGYQISSVQDPRFGRINTYPSVVLEEVFKQFDY